MRSVRTILALVIVFVSAYALLAAVAELPAYGSSEVPAMNAVTDRYLKVGVDEGGATNIVSDIIVDYRAYDTLMETTVLFTAILAVLITLKRK